MLRSHFCENWFSVTDEVVDTTLSCNISKTSASVSSGFPNTRKLMKARGRRPSAFIVFECLETPMKHEARVFEIASQSWIIKYTKNNKKFSLILASYAEYKLHLLLLFFSNYWPLLSNILAVSQGPSYLNETRIHPLISIRSFFRDMALSRFRQAKTTEEEMNILFKTRYSSPLNTKINSRMEYSKDGKGSLW